MRNPRNSVLRPGPQDVARDDPEQAADAVVLEPPPPTCTATEGAELRGGLPRDFHAAFDTLTLGACGVDETQKVFAPKVKPLQDALEREAGGEDSPSVKMIASLAAHSYANFTYHLGQLRQTGDRLLQGPALRQREQLQRLVERSFVQALQALEVLRRPGTSNVSVRVGSASNVNLGTQQVKLEGQEQGAQADQIRQRQKPSPK